ncbi:aldo/keto reductase [Bifidobacterium sp.]|uniref:aldo/keto reductase n=1 Tax=Bifidobacterium sp. TaxID=41200 RepID=UPI0025BE98B1|nr:aldo/keto reductase [Bifidobacterium sp.]MCI1635670.1 aldo/keto reductase [Bifidobacterium sp.]
MASMLQEHFTLLNGVEIPKIGFGTWLIEDNNKAAEAVQEAIKTGYRHIDTAEAYGNEVGVGEGVRSSGVDRKKIFVTTKLRAEYKDYEGAQRAIEESLEKLDLGYIDLMIIHSPKPWAKFGEEEHFFEGNLEAWKALEEAHAAGKIRAIGVSNFEQVDLQNIIDNSETVPAVDQVLAHIGNTPFELIDYARQRNILVEAYSPFGHGDMLRNADIQEIAERNKVSITQLAVRYLLQLDLLPLPKASSAEHMKQNADVDFVINDEDMSQLRAITKQQYSAANKKFPVYQA